MALTGQTGAETATRTRRLRDLARYVRFSRFDVSTEEGRRNERARKISLGALSSMLARATLVGSNLVLIPILLNYLGLELFGAWTAISSFTIFLSFADLGIGNGIINNVAAASGKDDTIEIRRSISNAYLLLLIVAAILLAALILAIFMEVPLSPIRSENDQIAAEINDAVRAFTILFILNIPASLIQKIQTGLQDTFHANVWQVASGCAALVGVLVSVQLGAHLAQIVLVYMGVPLAINLLNTIAFFCRSGVKYLPSLRFLRSSDLLDLLRVGSMFLAIQIMTALVYNSDAILISNLLGATWVPSYSIPERLMSLSTIVLSMALVPLWPAMGEALSRGEHTWVRQALRKALIAATSISALSGLVLILTMPWILDVWVGSKVAPPMALVVGLGIWKVLECSSYAYNAYLNGGRFYSFQTITSLLLTLTAFPAKVLAYSHFGVSGGVWALCLCYVACPGIPIALKIRKLLAQDTRA